MKTLEYTAGAFVIGLLGGTVLALMRLSRAAPYRWVATAYIELFRGLPALLVLVGYGIPLAFPGRESRGGCSARSRSGSGWSLRRTWPRRSGPASRRCRRDRWRRRAPSACRTGVAMRTIVIPQAFRIVIPPLTNELILLVKDSSLAYVLGVSARTIEVTKFGRDLLNTGRTPPR